MGKLAFPWTDEDLDRLRAFQATGVSLARAAAALKRKQHAVRVKARELGIPFKSLRDARADRLEKEKVARIAAGLTLEQDTHFRRTAPKSRDD